MTDRTLPRVGHSGHERDFVRAQRRMASEDGDDDIAAVLVAKEASLADLQGLLALRGQRLLRGGGDLMHAADKGHVDIVRHLAGDLMAAMPRRGPRGSRADLVAARPDRRLAVGRIERPLQHRIT